MRETRGVWGVKGIHMNRHGSKLTWYMYRDDKGCTESGMGSTWVAYTK